MRISADKLRLPQCVKLVVIACVISFFPLESTVSGQDSASKRKTDTGAPLEVSGSVEVGGQIQDLHGAHTAKFEEMRDVPKGFFVNKLALNLDSPDSPYFVRIRGLELRERDQRFAIEGGRIGRFRTEFVWDQIPHYFGTGQSFLIESAPGVYRVSQTLRAAFQALTLSDLVRTPADGPLATLVRHELQNAPLTEVRLRRDQASFKQSFQATNDVEIYAQFKWLRNRGIRPMSAGTFVRRAVPAAPLGDIGGLWEGIGQEFLEPLDQRTTDFKLGVQFGGNRWRAGVEYNLSLFRNRIDSLIFENPFRVSDEQGCNPACGASNRFRMVRWQTDLAPNNDSHSISFWGKFDLTKNTQIRGIVSVAYWTQDDAFLPWTLNTAIRPTDWDGSSPITNPTDVSQLPARSPNAKMRNITQEYALVNRRETFRFQARYRSQDVDNQTPQIVFPGYAAFGDSTWRAAVTDFYNLPIENLDWDFTRQNADAGFQWDVLPNLTWKLDYLWEGWNRKFRDVNRNNEHSIRNRLDFEFNLSGDNTGTTHTVQPVSLTTLRLKLDYRYANRRAQAYNTQPLTFCLQGQADCPSNTGGAPASSPQGAWVVTRFTVMQIGVPMEFNLLRRYDEMDRIRHDGRLTLELLRGPNTSLSASYRYLGDEHDQNFYGRLFNRSSFVDAQFSHIFDSGAFVYASYSRESNSFAYRNLAHLLPNPPAPPGTIVQGTLSQYPIANTWERTSRNDLDSFELGVNIVPQEGKLRNWQFDLAYALSSARDRITTFNPYIVRADSVLHAGANPYPDVVVRRQNVNLAVTRRINESYEIGARYWYEPYTQDDFSFNILQPYVHGNITSDAPKYLFQDARYGSYHANVVSVFLRYTF